MKIPWLFLLAWLVSGCGGEAPEKRESTRLMMGTLISITTFGLSAERDAKSVALAFDEMARIEADLSPQREETLVWRVNHAPRGTWREISPELAEVVAVALDWNARSAGAFDPGLEPLTRLWGFSREPPATAPPAPEALAAWRKGRPADGCGVELDQKHHRLRLATESVGLDLGAIAKGYAVDRALAVLREQGVENAVVNAGGNLAVMGGKAGKPWRIGIQSPRDSERVMGVSELLGRRALVTSGDYERFFLFEGRRYHHILDPASGEPARSGLASVSIQADWAMLADVLSTTVFVLGMEKGLALLAAQPGVEGALVGEDGSRRVTAGFMAEWLTP